MASPAVATALFVVTNLGLIAGVPVSTSGLTGQPPVPGPIQIDTLEAPARLMDESPDPGLVEVTLVAAPARIEMAPGIVTDGYAYNGMIPGPLLEVREGDRVRVHIRNELDEETTVHWHGLHLPFQADGSPIRPIPPGGEVDFEWVIPEGTAGTYWYHPHPDHVTGHQVAKGLYGGIIIRDPQDPLPPMTEKLLILSDNRFLDDGSVDIPERRSLQGRIDFENGREGDIMFVNGQVMPTIPIRSGEIQRWRVVNASAARVYRLALPGHEIVHVGSDGGLFEVPVPTDDILIANSERVEILVRGTGEPGSETPLRDLPYDRYIPQTRPADWDEPQDLLTLRYTDEDPVTPPPIPETLRRVEPIDPADATVERVFVLTQGFINGKTMDMARVDEVAELGATEIWQIENLVGMDHPFHLHGFSFQVLSRNGVPEPFPSWKDSVNVPKHETVRVIVRFDDYPGMWMYHCHILNHEDEGMMGILEVR